MADILNPGGRLLFTAVTQTAAWNDVMTGLELHSLGGEEYRRLLSKAGLLIVGEDKDEGENHYFDAIKVSADSRSPS